MPNSAKTEFFKRREPIGFMLNIALLGIALTFFALFVVVTFLSIDKKVSWDSGKMPSIFWYSTFLIALSSYTLEQASKYIKTENFAQYRTFLSATLLLGIGFIGLQIWGWQIMQMKGIHLRGGFLGAFLYVISGLHLLHLLVGIFFLAWRVRLAYQKKSYIESYIFHINPPNQFTWRFVVRYWHFVGIIWIVLFLFLLFKGFRTV